MMHWEFVKKPWGLTTQLWVWLLSSPSVWHFSFWFSLCTSCLMHSSIPYPYCDCSFIPFFFQLLCLRLVKIVVTKACCCIDDWSHSRWFWTCILIPLLSCTFLVFFPVTKQSFLFLWQHCCFPFSCISHCCTKSEKSVRLNWHLSIKWLYIWVVLTSWTYILSP